MKIVEKVLALPWDAPYRVAASVLAVAALVGAVLARSSLETLAVVRGFFAWPDGGVGLLVGRDWLLDR